MDSQTAAAGIGHNVPPDLLTILSEDHAQLSHDVDLVAARANEAPRKITRTDELDIVGTLVKDARTLAKKVDETRVRVKAPYLQATRDVDTYFATLGDRLARISDTFNKIASDYQRAVVAEARAKAEAEARRLRDEEARRIELALQAEADNRQAHADRHTAKAAEAIEKAEVAETIANAPAADLTRTRTASGVLATAQTVWSFEIVDFEKIPLDKLRSYIKRDAIEAAIRLAVKMGNRDLPGVRIFEDVKAQFR